MSELLGFAPLWLLLIGALALLLADAFARQREPGFLRGLALVFVGAALVGACTRLGAPELDLGGFALAGALAFDHLTTLCDVIALVSLAGIVALARERERAREPLLLLAGFAALTVIHAGDLLVLWLGVELFAIAAALTMFAGPTGAPEPRRDALIAQLLAGAVISCFSLLGIAMIYAALGSTSLDGFARAATRVFAQWGGTQRWVLLTERFGAELAQQDPSALHKARNEIVHGLAPAAMFLPGLLLLLGGLLARLGLLPFARRRELVETAPLHVIALWSSLAVVALVAALLRVYAGALHSPRLVNEPYGWTGALPTLAVLTGGWAAIAAVRQRRLSRVISLLAIVQVSLLVLGIVAGAGFHGHIGVGGRLVAPEAEILWARVTGDEAFAAVLLLLAAHVIAVVGCFAAIAAGRGTDGPDVRMQHWSGMAARRPALALAFGLCLCSLVGLPPLAGFIGKLGLLRALVEHSALRWMVLVIVIEQAACAWIALRIIAAMLFGDEVVSEPGERPSPGPWPGRVAGIMAALGLVMGLAGQRTLELVRLPAAGVVFEPGDPDRRDWLEQRREHWAAEQTRAIEADAPAPSEPDPNEADTEQRSLAEPTSN